MSKNTDLGNLVNGLFVSSANNVGIGTTAPSYKLHVTGTSGVGARTIQADGTGTAFNIVSVINNGSQMFLAAEGSTAGTVATGSLAYAGLIDMNTNTALQFATFATVRMTISNGGNVGIGTTNPTYKLQVEGNTFLHGDISFGLYGETTYFRSVQVLNYLVIGGSENITFQTYNNDAWGARMTIKKNGIINFSNVPSSSSGLSSGDVYKIGGTLMIV